MRPSLTLGLAALALQATSIHARVYGVIDAVSNGTYVTAALEQNYSYIIIGGGTGGSLTSLPLPVPKHLLTFRLLPAGIALAGRLSADPDNTVLVLEAGTRWVPCDGARAGGLSLIALTR
jgi:hypothetical protein